MGFFMKSRGVADVPCYENVPCGAIKPEIGLALKLGDGVLTVCSGTDKPGYISDAKRDETVSEYNSHYTIELNTCIYCYKHCHRRKF